MFKEVFRVDYVKIRILEWDLLGFNVALNDLPPLRIEIDEVSTILAVSASYI